MTTTLQNIGFIVSKVAPLLGSLIPIPGASAAITLLSDAFGATGIDDLYNKINSDPTAMVKIAQIEADNKETLHALNNQIILGKIQYQEQLAEIDSSDRVNARARELAKKGRDYMPPCIAGAIILGLIIIIVLIALWNIPSQEITVLSVIATMLARELKSVVDYYFGGSSDDNP